MKHFTLKISTLSLFLMFILFSCGDKKKITLEYNLKQGETLKQNMVMNMDMVQNMMGQEIKISLAMTMKMAFDVKESQGDDYTLEVKFKNIKTNMGMPGMGNISFDSDTPDDVTTQDNIGPMFKAVIDIPFEVVMDKAGKAKSVQGIEKLFEAMLGSFDESMPEAMRQQLIGQLGSQFSEEAFKSQFEQSTGYFPGKPVATGESWNVKIRTTASNFAANIDSKVTLKSVEDNVVTLNIDGIVSTPEGYEQEVNGMKTKVTLNGTQKGTSKVNRDTGWIISSDLTINFTGEVEVMGMKVPVYIVSKVTVSGE
ncbi:MAG: DUF6263 family protein [Prevotellaceae bacterium]|nr:DUF6263 family protein [Prevotellaceae bacterium]